MIQKFIKKILFLCTVLFRRFKKRKIKNRSVELGVFAPIYNFRWICTIPGLDPFLFQSVDVGNIYHYGEHVSHLNFRIYNDVAGRAIKGLKDLIKIEAFPVQIDRLDDKGNIVEKMFFNSCLVRHIYYGKLEYSSSDISTIELGLCYYPRDFSIEVL